MNITFPLLNQGEFKTSTIKTIQLHSKDIQMDDEQASDPDQKEVCSTVEQQGRMCNATATNLIAFPGTNQEGSSSNLKGLALTTLLFMPCPLQNPEVISSLQATNKLLSARSHPHGSKL